MKKETVMLTEREVLEALKMNYASPLKEFIADWLELQRLLQAEKDKRKEALPICWSCGYPVKQESSPATSKSPDGYLPQDQADAFESSLKKKHKKLGQPSDECSEPGCKDGQYWDDTGSHYCLKCNGTGKADG